MPRRLLAWLLVLAVAACAPSPQPARPAFWEVTGSHGERGWLLGTIHSLPRPALWRSAAIDQALKQSDIVAVEVNLNDNTAVSGAFARLAHTPGEPPLSARVDPALRGALDKLLDQARMGDGDFADTETWAVALSLARTGEGSLDSSYGIDRAVLRAAAGKQVVELEGVNKQLGLFDAMPEAQQRELLNAVVREGGRDGTDSGSLVEAWRKGDFAAIEAETHRGMLANPGLRQTLFTGRNRDWSAQVAAMLARGNHPFVAVGAAHMAGTEGLPAMLAAQGFTVRRLQ